MTPRADRDRLKATAQEMRLRAEEGCTGTHDGACCDPDMDIHPEDWCNRCLMGTAAVGLLTDLAALEAVARRLLDLLSDGHEPCAEMATCKHGDYCAIVNDARALLAGRTEEGA